MRAKETDAISGMHMPSGENLWASPADDEEEEEGEDMKKKALGLTSIPGEQQMDYQLEQPFHVKDPDNVGVIDVETVTDMPPMNNAEDSSPEKKMEELLEDLIKHLESKGYSDKAELIKSAYPGQAGGVPHPQYKSKSRPSAPQTSAPEANYGTSENEYTSEETRESFLSVDDMIKAGLLTQQQAEWLREQSLTQSFPPKVLSKELGMDMEYAGQLSRLLAEEAQVARRSQQAKQQQAAKSRGASGWEGYAASGEDQKALSDAWQASPPEGYTSDFSSFQKWYMKKYRDLGKHFGPVDAMRMIGASTEPEEAEKPDEAAVGMTGDEKPQEGSQEVTEEVPGQVAIEPTRDNISKAIRRLLQGMPMTAPGVDANVLESGKVKRMTKRYLRGIGSDRTIRSQEDQDKVVGLAASAITQVDLNGKSFEDAVAETLEGLEGNAARQAFDGVVWQFLQRAWAAYGSVRGKEVSDRREQRRLRRLDRQQDRQFDRAERRSQR